MDDFYEQLFFESITSTHWEGFIKQTPLSSKIDWERGKIKWENFTDENDPALDLLTTLLLQFLLRKTHLLQDSEESGNTQENFLKR